MPRHGRRPRHRRGDVACGAVPDLTPRRREAAAVRFLYPAADCRFVDAGASPATDAHGDWRVRREITAQPGDELRIPPRGFGSRFGYVVVKGADARACADRLDVVARGVTVRTEPLRARRPSRAVTEPA